MLKKMRDAIELNHGGFKIDDSFSNGFEVTFPSGWKVFIGERDGKIGFALSEEVDKWGEGGCVSSIKELKDESAAVELISDLSKWF